MCSSTREASQLVHSKLMSRNSINLKTISNEPLTQTLTRPPTDRAKDTSKAKSAPKVNSQRKPTNQSKSKPKAKRHNPSQKKAAKQGVGSTHLGLPLNNTQSFNMISSLFSQYKTLNRLPLSIFNTQDENTVNGATRRQGTVVNGTVVNGTVVNGTIVSGQTASGYMAPNG